MLDAIPREEIVAAMDRMVDELLHAAGIEAPPVDVIALAQNHLGMEIASCPRRAEPGRADVAGHPGFGEVDRLAQAGLAVGGAGGIARRVDDKADSVVLVGAERPFCRFPGIMPSRSPLLSCGVRRLVEGEVCESW